MHKVTTSLPLKAQKLPQLKQKSLSLAGGLRFLAGREDTIVADDTVAGCSILIGVCSSVKGQVSWKVSSSGVMSALD